MKMLDIFHRTMLLRKQNKIDALLLLTNNSNRPVKSNGIKTKYLDLVNRQLVETYNTKYHPEKISSINDMFDNIYTAENSVPKGARNRTYNIVKAIPWIGEPVIIHKPGPNMTGLRFRPAKNINTVKNMLKTMRRKVNTNNLEQRIYFFDDEIIDHAIKAEIGNKGGAYIRITPPFGEDTEDTTDFSPILTLLQNLEKKNGGKRKKTYKNKM